MIFLELSLRLEIAENLRSMEFKIDELAREKNGLSQSVPVASESSEQYKEVREKLTQLVETQNSIKVNYEKLIDASKKRVETVINNAAINND